MSNPLENQPIHFESAVVYAMKFGKIRVVQRTKTHKGSQMKIDDGVIIIQKTYEKSKRF